MKILKNLILLAVVALGSYSCELEDPIGSEVTEYAEFQMEGSQYMYVDQGTSYEEPGVTATAGGEELEVSVNGTVDATTPGLYILEYSAVNADGFPASTTRYVAVGDKDVALGRDLSGLYKTSSGGENEVTQFAPGFYMNSDTLPANSISVFMVDLGNGSLVIPPQSTRFGTVAADPTLYEDSFVTLNSDGSLTIAQFISCCGIYTRTFTK